MCKQNLCFFRRTTLVIQSPHVWVYFRDFRRSRWDHKMIWGPFNQEFLFEAFWCPAASWAHDLAWGFYVVTSPWLDFRRILLISSALSPIDLCFCPCSCPIVTNSFSLHCRTFPIRGFQIYDGPVQLTQSTFRGFMPTPERYTSAVGFNLKNTWQLTPRNNLSQLFFQPTVGLVLEIMLF